MQILSRLILIALPILAILWFLIAVNNILLPFIVGVIFAYFLDPAALLLQKKGLSRTNASLLVLIAFLTILTLFFYSIGPLLYQQLAAFIGSIPHYFNSLNQFVTPHVQDFYERLGQQNNFDETTLLKQASHYLVTSGQQIMGNIWQSSLAFINLFSLILISPIVTFYLLKDWHKMLEQISSLFPKKYKTEIKQIFQDIDAVLSGYLRGQTNVCLLLGIFYALGLTLVGLKYGFLIGFLTGLFSFIPYFGVLIGMVVGLIVAAFQFKSLLLVLVILAVFLLGQFLEGNFVTPKFVGDKIGIHPALIIFALLCGATLFGFVGILFAIPAIAISGVLVRFTVKKYKKTRLFLNAK